MNVTAFVALVFAVLLGLEWRYRLGSVRFVTALFALIVLLFAQPLPRRAARWAIEAPPTDRITEFLGGRALSAYSSGVMTMEQAVVEDSNMGAHARLFGIGVLFWLACSPVLRRAPRLRLKDDLEKGSSG